METAVRKFTEKWVLACAAGELLGLSGAAVISIKLDIFSAPQSPADVVIKLAGTALTGAFEGACLGIFQWWGLKRKFMAIPYKEWVGVTMLVAITGWLLGMIYPMFFANGSNADNAGAQMPVYMVLIMASVMGFGLGAVFGAAQWIVLQKYTARAGLWIWANAAGWAAAMVVIFLGATLPGENTPQIVIWFGAAISGLLAGLAVGAFTGWGLKYVKPLQE